MEAVYQQTTAQLLARGLIFALFAPLAVDADQRWLERAASLVTERARDEHDRADLGAAMVVLAEADGQRRGLGPLLLRLLDSELVMQSSIYTMGKEAGLREGKETGLREGKETGLREGKARGRREAIEALCEVLSIRLTPRRREKLTALDDEGLEALLGSLRSGRRWPR
jgi:flagellar biosynthesis/type III secretory pathway protein FliH